MDLECSRSGRADALVSLSKTHTLPPPPRGGLKTRKLQPIIADHTEQGDGLKWRRAALHVPRARGPQTLLTAESLKPWEAAPVRPPCAGQQRSTEWPLALPLCRKPRGEAKKCRKVYGMENRNMWCTACRWKKACQRFVD